MAGLNREEKSLPSSASKAVTLLKTASACCATYDALGVRYMTLTHSNTNNWADSSGDIAKAQVKHHGGLTETGRQVVAEMNRLGMMVDISHVADDTFRNVLEISKAPVIATHSSCRAISGIARNMTDEMIVALAAKRGVISINFGCEFLSAKIGRYRLLVLHARGKERHARAARDVFTTLSATSITSSKSRASMRSASAATSTASNASPSEWKSLEVFPASRGPCSKRGILPK